MNPLTVVYTTSRNEPHFEWLFGSLASQLGERKNIRIIVVDALLDQRDTHKDWQNFKRHFVVTDNVTCVSVLPKPTIFQGKHRLTKEDWWAKSNALNTGICLCKTEWIAFMDDRSVLMPGWLDAIERAQEGNFAVCGRYEKRANMKVVDGVISDPGELLGADHRPDLPHPQPTADWFGGHGALPLEWALAVGGFSEDLCDSLGSEDSQFGTCLWNAGFTMKYDATMRIVEDRTPGEIEGALKRADKGVSPNDKSHAIVAKFAGARHSMNSFDIRAVRESVLAGNPWPPPSASHYDWFDGQSISEMT